MIEYLLIKSNTYTESDTILIKSVGKELYESNTKSQCITLQKSNY